MVFGLGQGEHALDAAGRNGLYLASQRLAMVNHMMRTQALTPLDGFRPGGGGNDFEAGKLLCQLRGDGADAPRPAHNQQRAFRRLIEAQAVEQRFPSGDGGQR